MGLHERLKVVVLEGQKGLTAKKRDVLREDLLELFVKLTEDHEGLQAKQLEGLMRWLLEWRGKTEQLMVFHLPVVEAHLECAVAGLVAAVDGVVCVDAAVFGYSAVADREALVSIRVQPVVPPSHRHPLALAVERDVVPRALRFVTAQYHP